MKVIEMCENCEWHLQHDESLFWAYQQIVEAWAVGKPLEFMTLLDGNSPAAFHTLEFYEFIRTTEADSPDWVKAIPVNCPHVKKKRGL